MYRYNMLVDHIHDGDTIMGMVEVVRNEDFKKKAVRLARINSPEVDKPEQKEAGEKAQKYLASLVPVGAKITVEHKSTDLYGRWVCEVTYNGLNLSDEMLKSGNAVLYKTAK